MSPALRKLAVRLVGEAGSNWHDGKANLCICNLSWKLKQTPACMTELVTGSQ